MSPDEIRRADAAYVSFPPFAQWVETVVDPYRWDESVALLKIRGDVSPELLAKAREVATRAAAIDTGAIEGLYDVDRGFTYTVATQAALWEAALDAKGAKTRSLIESQLRAYEYVLDFATGSRPVTEAWIRTLHEELCLAQERYTVVTEIGLQSQTLPLGQYKVLPNHPRRHDGIVHAYAPVDMTAAEMHRFCQELNTPAFLAAHPALQASYAHYAFVVIHPFADGNGRVARALASVFTYRSHGAPILILTEHRDAYYRVLEAADAGQYQPFVGFITDRAVDAILLVDETLRAALAPQPEDALAKLRRLHTTRGGYTHAEVDQAGIALLQALRERMDTIAEEQQLGPEIQYAIATNARVVVAASEASHRLPSGTDQVIRTLDISLRSASPASAEVLVPMHVEVPMAGGADDMVILRNTATGETFRARLSETIPVVAGTVQIRLAVFARRLLGDALNTLSQWASQALRKQGY